MRPHTILLADLAVISGKLKPVHTATKTFKKLITRVVATDRPPNIIKTVNIQLNAI